MKKKASYNNTNFRTVPKDNFAMHEGKKHTVKFKKDGKHCSVSCRYYDDYECLLFNKKLTFNLNSACYLRDLNCITMAI